MLFYMKRAVEWVIFIFLVLVGIGAMGAILYWLLPTDTEAVRYENVHNVSMQDGSYTLTYRPQVGPDTASIAFPADKTTLVADVKEGESQWAESFHVMSRAKLKNGKPKAVTIHVRAAQPASK